MDSGKAPKVLKSPNDQILEQHSHLFWSKGWDGPVALQVLPIHLSTLKRWTDQASKYLQTPQNFESILLSGAPPQ